MNWHWLAPEPDKFISGGNIYNNKMMYALRRLQDQASTISIYQYRQQVAAPSDIVIWDTIYIGELDELEQIRCPNIFLLVHMVNENVLKALPEILKKIKACIVPSNWAANQLSLIGLRPSQIIVIEPGMDMISGISHSHPLSEKLQLLQIANLVPEKGHEELMLALKQHNAKHLDFELDLYGDDRINSLWSKYILKLIDELDGEPIVRFKGRIPHLKIWETLPSYQALLSVSPIESFGMAIQEAISIGLPVLAIRGGNISSLVRHGENGYLFDNLNQVMSWLDQPLEEQLDLLAQLNMAANSESNIPDWDQQATLLRSAILKFCG